MFNSSTPLIIAALENLFQVLSPWVEALLRVIVGLALVPHGLRMTFGFFPNTGLPIRNLSMLADQLDRTGYRPAKLWAVAISLTQLIGGPLLALGLFTRLAGVPIVIFLFVSCIERWRVGRYFWNTLGLEYTLMWAVAALFFLVRGGGMYSLDHFLLGHRF
jgi:putative oxidoreductase